MTHEDVIAERAIDMREAAGQGINADGISVGLFGHPAACFTMDKAAPVADLQDPRLVFYLVHGSNIAP
jgi:hypothetical protein